jgi:hypothetical protein
MIARAHTTPEGDTVTFDDVWKNRVSVAVGGGVSVVVPRIEDLIRTKRWSIGREIDAIWNAPLPREEFLRRERQAIEELDGPEGENIAALIAWFQRRYPTARDRLRYIRRKVAEAKASAALR